GGGIAVVGGPAGGGDLRPPGGRRNHPDRAAGVAAYVVRLGVPADSVCRRGRVTDLDEPVRRPRPARAALGLPGGGRPAGDPRPVPGWDRLADPDEDPAGRLLHTRPRRPHAHPPPDRGRT